MSSIKTYMPQAIVTFYNEKSRLVAKASNSNEKMDDDVISVSTRRDMGADAPTFTIMLTRRKPWHILLGANDLVYISMQRPPETLDYVFVGLIDDVRKKVIIGEDGIPKRVISVSGRGVSKAFIQFDIGVIPEANIEMYKTGWVTAAGITLAGQDPATILTTIWDTLATEHVNYIWDELVLFNIIGHEFTSRPDMKMLDETGLITWQGSLWAFMKEIGESPFYELYWEIYDSVPKLILRTTPFSKENWNKLQEYHITDEDIVQEDIGRSDVETYALYSVGMKCLFSKSDAYKTTGLKPLWNEEYAKKYGLRRLHVTSSYMAVADESDATEVDVMRQLQIDLFNWNIKNNSMFNGTLAVKGSNRYKVGYKLRYTSEADNTEMTFYIKSVSHHFVNFGSWMTILEVTRGLPEAERFTAPYDKFEEYTDIGFTPFGIDGGGEGIFDSEKAMAVVNGAIALMKTGKIKYVFGGPGIEYGKADCSQFTQYCYLKYGGVDIGRNTGTQVSKGKAVNKQSDLKPGDLILFKNTYPNNYPMGASHVGIYIGSGKFIHNSSGAGGITISELKGSYYQEHYLMGRRIFESTGSGFVGGSGLGAKFNKYLKGKLKGQGDNFVAAAKKYNIDAYVLTAISMQETGNGNVLNYNNPGGLMRSGGGLFHYNSLREGIFAMARNLRVLYWDEGRNTLEKIKPKYCPDGAANDPGGQNKYWLPGCNYFLKQLKKG